MLDPRVGWLTICVRPVRCVKAVSDNCRRKSTCRL